MFHLACGQLIEHKDPERALTEETACKAGKPALVKERVRILACLNLNCMTGVKFDYEHVASHTEVATQK